MPDDFSKPPINFTKNMINHRILKNGDLEILVNVDLVKRPVKDLSQPQI